MVNRLSDALSPYLLQHAANPVDWWPWGEEAFAEARRRDVPILLSIGYAACHWCHVMAHESFEDPEIAAVINRTVVPVKVDREELPDVDAVYMNALQLMRGQGGWPLTAFLDHEARPFYAGTYFPPQPRRGQPGFGELVEAIGNTWRDNREQVTQVGGQVSTRVHDLGEALVGAIPTGETLPLPGPADLDAALEVLAGDFDASWGGFSGAPKFPPALTLVQLLFHRARAGSPASDLPDPLDMVARTLTHMAGGGIYDQLSGCFARYAVDRTWTVPHFEQMLYDNALLLRAAVEWWRHERAQDPDSGRSALSEYLVRGLVDGLDSRFGTMTGGFISSLDADSLPDTSSETPEEGAAYVWTPAQLEAALGELDAPWAAITLGVTSGGTFEHGASVLQVPRLWEAVEADEPLLFDDPRYRAVRERLAGARALRPAPTKDDKIVAAWNGLAITALVHAGMTLPGGASEAALFAATAAANDVLGTQWHGGRLRRVSRRGEAGGHPGQLDDYASLAVACAALYQSTGQRGWLTTAASLADAIREDFVESADGLIRFFDAPAGNNLLPVRPSDPTDSATPSGRSLAGEAFWQLAELLPSDDARIAEYRELAEAAIAGYTVLAGQAPRGAGWGLAQAEALAAGPIRVGTRNPTLARAAWNTPGAGVVIDPDPAELAEGDTRAVVCRGSVCSLPLTTADDLRAALLSDPSRGKDQS